MELKQYQKNTLSKLGIFLKEARILNPAEAFSRNRDAKGYIPEYRPIAGLEDAPYICLRLPTGGGKTLLASYAISSTAEEFLEREYPIVIWLVPTDVIRKQTLEVLRNSLQENRRILDLKFHGRVKVYDITEFVQVTPQDLAQNVNIFVSTFAAFRKQKPEYRKVYESNENFERFFTKIPMQDYFDLDEAGQARYSFRNLLAYYRPLMLIDEAHNHSSELSTETLQRLRPSVIVEFTATPSDNSNVLFKVSASELKNEDMIKLPVKLVEDQSWEDAVTTSVQKRKHLESIAQKEPDYVRPIILFQAESKDKDVTVEVLKKYLVEQLDLPEVQIAIATGDQKELDGINLFDETCPIRYIITVEALKEGWDCSLAYIFCSTAKVQSSKDAEQLLGRVLRMPYAKRRVHDELNYAYAYVAVASWMEAVGRIKDNLLDIGFEEQEIKEEVEYLPPTPLFPSEEIEAAKENNTITFHTEASLKMEEVNDFHFEYETVLDKSGRTKTTIKNVTSKLLDKLEEAAAKICPEEDDRNMILSKIKVIQSIKKILSPAQKGTPFDVPQLCFDFGEGAELVEKDDFLPETWTLVDSAPVALPNFRVNHEEHVYEFDILGRKLVEKAHQQSFTVSGYETTWTVQELIGWLNFKCKQRDISEPQMIEYLREVLNYFMEKEHANLADLVRLRYTLVKILLDVIADTRKAVLEKGFQDVLFAKDAPTDVIPDIHMSFQEGNYPAVSLYTGSYQFQNHYFSVVGSFDGGEEIECAKCIDSHPNVEFWVRNIANHPESSFWLPTYKWKFYPDFVVKLKDGRIAAIEYKGGDRISNDDSKVKNTVGCVWEKASHGSCLFLMATMKDKKGNNLGEQIYKKLNKK